MLPCQCNGSCVSRTAIPQELWHLSKRAVAFLRHWGRRFWETDDGWVWEAVVADQVEGYRPGDAGNTLRHWSLEAI